MNRVYSSREMTPQEMSRLAEELSRCGFRTAAVGKNYIAFYERVEIRRMANGSALQRSRPMLHNAGTAD